MQDKPWSISALDAFENCPKKYWSEKVGRTKKEIPNAQADYGTQGHKIFENRVLRDKPLPLDFKVHEPAMLALQKPKSKPHIEVLPEQKLALNRKLQPVGFFDNDVWVRAVLDYVRLDHEAKEGLVVDYKFGRKHNKDDQLLLSAFMLFFHTDMESILGLYYWAKSREKSPPIHVVRQPRGANHLTPGYILEWFLPRVNAFQEAHRRDNWPARPNFLCRRHCPVKECPYHGV